MSGVEFRSISKLYGNHAILRDLDLSVDQGEFLVLLGPSGCGKTTLLNILAGLTEPTAGEVIIEGREVTELDPKDRGIAMVFQSYALYPTKTVRGNLKFGLESRGLAREDCERRIAWAAKLLQIDHLLDRKPAQLSGGQRQRVAIGRALVKQVAVCLFDEPLSNLDAKLRTEMRMEIKKLHTELKNTVVYVTHDQVEAMTMATKIAVMNLGVIQQIGAPDEIYENPETRFVAEFIGTPAMNFFDARLEIANGSILAVDKGNDLQFRLDGYPFRSPPKPGQAVTIGIRPEHVVVVQGAEGARRLPKHYFEKIGPEAIAFLSLPKQSLAVRMDAESGALIQRAEALDVVLPGEKAKVFDAETGRRL